MTATDERALLIRWRLHHDESARAELVERLMPFVHRIAQGFAGRGEALDDLAQVGAIGLINAIDRFDLERGGRLSTFAAPNISGEIKRHFRDRGWAVHVPRGLQELHAKIGVATTRISGELGRAPTVMELAQALESSEELILEAMNAGRNYRAASLDEPSSDDEDARSPASALGADDPGYETAEHRAVLKQGMRALTERERLILQLRYEQDLAQHEIAQQVGLSQMHVSRLLRRSVDDMRAVLDVPDAVPASSNTA